MSKQKVGLIILNYNGWKDTINCINSCKSNLNGNSYEIITIVVDNNSTDDSFNKLKDEISDDAFLLESGKNIGYAAGNNIGIRKAIKLNCDYFCILNNDTIIDEDFVTPCIEFLEKNKNSGFVGPAIVNYSDGKVQSTGGTITLNTHRNITKHNNEFIESSELKALYRCDYVEGACILCRRSLVDEVGLIPECYFLFYEETEWCYKALKKGYKNYCIGAVIIRHKGSVSINKISGLSEYLLCRNQVRFIRRNHSNQKEAFLIYIKLCLYSLATFPFRGLNRVKQIRYYGDGWNNRIDFKKYPFIYICDEKWDMAKRIINENKDKKKSKMD